MDGFETCRQLKLDAATCKIPVIFMTTLNQEADKVKGFQAGGVDYITKPIQVEELLMRVKTHLQLHFLNRIFTTQAERQQRRELQIQLETQGVAEATRIATQLTLLRLDDFQPYQSLVGDRDAPATLEVAYNLVLQYQNASSIQQEVDRAAKIVFALKTYTHHSECSERSLVQITDGIEVALTLYHSSLKKGIQVIHRYAPNLPQVLCNPDELTQIWVNLIDNALFSMGQQGTLEIVTTQKGDRIQVEITDSGSGIPPDLQSRIFAPFFTTKPRGEGSGLGLDIVRRIVQQHRGTIQVQSQPGRTTFTVQLPLGH
jgi:signal transduction histidine kinase